MSTGADPYMGRERRAELVSDVELVQRESPLVPQQVVAAAEQDEVVEGAVAVVGSSSRVPSSRRRSDSTRPTVRATSGVCNVERSK